MPDLKPRYLVAGRTLSAPPAREPAPPLWWWLALAAALGAVLVGLVFAAVELLL